MVYYGLGLAKNSVPVERLGPALAGTELARATAGSVRVKLLKVAGKCA